jgi:flagellar biosynthesis protein FliR
MSYRSIFDAKTTSETSSVPFDFSSQFTNAGESITSVTVTATVYSGVDPSPGAIRSGSPGFSGKVATQTLVGGVAGVTYLLVATAVSSLGATRSVSGYLSVLG